MENWSQDCAYDLVADADSVAGPWLYNACNIAALLNFSLIYANLGKLGCLHY
jgi:hypothetical protein